MIFLNFFWDRPDLAQKETGPRSAQKETGLKSAQNEIEPEPAQKRTYFWLDSTQPHGLG